MTNRRKNDEGFHDVISQSHSDDDLHMHSNSNINDCNLLLNNKKHPDTSIFDDSSLATVTAALIMSLLLVENKFFLSPFTN